MTLREMIAANPSRFYAQTWYADEAFLDDSPRHTATPGFRLKPTVFMPSAATLASCYLNDPENLIWRYGFWTSDHDRNGWPVFVGWVGLNKPGQFEIHRRVDYSNVGYPVWT